MNTIELKTNLIRRIQQTNNNDLLNYLLRIISQTESEAVYALNSFEKEVINKGLEQHKNGESIPHEQVMNEIEKWLEVSRS